MALAFITASRRLLTVSVSFALRAIEARCAVVLVRFDVIGARVAVRGMVAVRAVFGVVAVRDVVVARDEVLTVARGEILRVAVRDVVDTFAVARGVVVRSRKDCTFLVVAFATRDDAAMVADVSGVFVFCRVDATVLVAPRRVAARTASSDSLAHTSPILSNARHTAKITLIPFILIWNSVANFRKLGQAKYVLNYRIFVRFWCG